MEDYFSEFCTKWQNIKKAAESKKKIFNIHRFATQENLFIVLVCLTTKADPLFAIKKLRIVLCDISPAAEDSDHNGKNQKRRISTVNQLASSFFGQVE